MTNLVNRQFGLSIKLGLTLVLAAQLGVALLVLASDIDERWFSRMTQDESHPIAPVSPGDQLRRYEPSRVHPSFIHPASHPEEIKLPRDLPSRLEFRVLEGSEGEFILINGPIEFGDAERFSAFLSRLDDLQISVALNSPGGSVTEALALGRMLRESEATTIVHSGTACLSACPYVLAGGARRHISRNAAVGMHQHYYETPGYLPALWAVEDIQYGQGQTMQYLLEMGISPSLMLYSLNTPPESIYILVEEEMLETGLATKIFE